VKKRPGSTARRCVRPGRRHPTSWPSFGPCRRRRGVGRDGGGRRGAA